MGTGHTKFLKCIVGYGIWLHVCNTRKKKLHYYNFKMNNLDEVVAFFTYKYQGVKLDKIALKCK